MYPSNYSVDDRRVIANVKQNDFERSICSCNFAPVDLNDRKRTEPYMVSR